MRLRVLGMAGVGPFGEVSMTFLDGPDDPRKVSLITGENGTGKTIVIDAIRALFGDEFAHVERDLARRGERVELAAGFTHDGLDTGAELVFDAKPGWGGIMHDVPVGANARDIRPMLTIARDLRAGGSAPGWIVDYWRSEIARDSGKIEGIAPTDHRLCLRSSLQGTYLNADVTRQLCFIDYLRDSRNNKAEARAGHALWSVAERIVAASLLDGGKLDAVERATFTPMVRQAGSTVPLTNLSSGNAYLIGRMLTLLGRMYSISVLRGSDPAEARLLPGLLLIDEAENHLHPKWQKRFLSSILEVFPNLQIIATTHSPFVLASIPDARVFVCRYDPATERCTVEEESAAYQYLPVDEILASEAFDGTRPFGAEVSKLLDDRDVAIEAGNTATRQRVEDRLRQLNPTYFGYLDLDQQIAKFRRAGG